MGADMMIMPVIMYGVHGLNGEDDLDNRKRRMLNEISLVSVKDMEDFKANLADGDYVFEDFDESSTELMTSIVEDFFKVIGARDVTFEIVADLTIWITGGMSYGDEPTDACSKFEMFNYLPYNVRIAGAFR